MGQSLRVLLTNTKKKIRNNQLKSMYEDIREKIKIGKEEKR